jgi:signal transduction histidine kinase
VRRAAEDVAGRLGAHVTFELADVGGVAPGVQEAAVRIVREAVTNAVRHGNAQRVTVRLLTAPELTLEISDDGLGFDPPTVTAGFGLTSMRERAEGAGGRYLLESHRGRGTTVEVRWPKNRDVES